MFSTIRTDQRMAQSARFLWHVVQMALAMMVGMGALAIVLLAAQQQDLNTTSPELYATVMGVAMVVPMAGWMRVRGHTWERAAEMSAAMLVPMLVFVAVCAVGLLPHTAVRPGTGVLMWAGMLGIMLYRRADYIGHEHAHQWRHHRTGRGRDALA